MKSSCDACHEGSEKASTGASMVEQQTAIKTKMTEVEKAVVATANKKQATEAGNLLKLVVEDRSFGAHNPKKAMAILSDALKIVSKK